MLLRIDWARLVPFIFACIESPATAAFPPTTALPNTIMGGCGIACATDVRANVTPNASTITASSIFTVLFKLIRPAHSSCAKQ